MASKWDDEFDLDDEPQRKKAKQDKKNRNSTTNNDYYDLDEEPKNIKLPTIAKQSAPTIDKNTKSTASINLAEIPKRKAEVPPPAKAPKYEQEEEDYMEESLAPNPSFKQKSPKVEQKKAASPPKKEEEEEDYANEDFEEDKYEEDFEPHEEHKPSPVGYKPKQQPKAPAKTINVPKPAPKDRKGAESVVKKNEIGNKANSRNSIRSQSASRSTHNSRPKVEEKKDDPPNKYTNLAEKTCPSYDRTSLEECNMDRLTRQNDKIRGLIKKFNDELNDLINRNIMQLKNKKEEKVVVPEDVLKVLEEQRNSNQTALQTTIKELQRLKGKEGELRQEQYHLTLDQKISETKNALVQISKTITKLKLEVNNEGNKLTKIDKQSSSTQDINNIKSNLLTIKKDEEKNDQVLEKLYIKCEELSKKITEAEVKYNTQLEEAKAKGLSVQISPELIKKAEDIKKKIDICRIHKSKTESLFKTKCQMISHECQQVKIQIKAVENSTQVGANNCQQIQNESRRLVDKARKTSKLSEQLLATLQNIIAQLENGTPRSNRDKEDSSFSHPRGAKKYQSQKNVEKIVPVSNPKESQDDANLKRPNLFKKKQKEEEKQDERVWKDDKNTQIKKPEKVSPIPELAKFENKEEGEKKDDDKKKPFTIKRNKQTKPQSDVAPEAIKEEPKIQKVEPKKQPEKNQEAPSLAPRMMKFRRNKQEDAPKPEQTKQTIQKPVSNPTVHKEQPKVEEKIVQQQPEKPIFAPKRFNLKMKDRTSQEAGYVATVSEKKQEPKVIEQFKPKGLTVDKEPFILAPEPKAEPLKTIEPKITSEQEEKPRFNLRLRDRQKESNKPEQKNQIAQQPAKESQTKIAISLDDKAKENNQYANPYANAEAPKRERQGPLKKPKPAQNVQKQNFNIYQQAEDITNVKEIKTGGESPKVTAPIKQTNDEPNLHDLLGIKKNKQQVDEDLLIDAATLAGKAKGKRESKKETNFFGDLQL